ncbi:DUF4421 domain-containing protein [bacterium]|nr:DUF4421 domain-containing protein [bacterium]
MKALFLLKQFFFGLLVFLAANGALADSRVEEIPGKVSVRVGTTLPSIPLAIQSATGSALSPAFEYEQNPAPKVGVGVDYSWWGFYLSFADTEHEKDPAVYGDTQYFDFQLHSYLGQWGVDFYWQDFKGYHVATPSEITGAQPAVVRPDLKSGYIGVNVFYLYNPERMSLVATGNGTAIQTTSGGSWMLYGGVGQQTISSDAVLAPPGFETDYGRLGNIQTAEFKIVSFGGGYGYNIVIGGPWYLHLSAQLALGPQHQEYTTRDYGRTSEWKFAGKGTGRTGLGFSGKKYFGAISIVADTTYMQIDDVTLDFISTQSFAYIGVRF